MSEWLSAVPDKLDRYAGQAMDRRDRQVRRAARQREVAHLIRALRLRAGLTQEALALRMTRLGEPTSRSQVSMWEIAGEKGQMPSTEKLLAVLEATEPEDRPETVEERQGRLLRARLTDLPRPRPPDARAK